MTPDELKRCREVLRWSWHDLERITGIPERHWRRMAAGERPIPPGIAAGIAAGAGAVEGAVRILEQGDPKRRTLTRDRRHNLSEGR